MKISQKFYLQAVKSSHSFTSNEFEFVATCFKRTSDSYNVVIDIDEQDFEFEIPNISQEKLTLAHVDQLRGIKTKLKADTEVQLQSLDEQIESLLALEYIEGDK